MSTNSNPLNIKLRKHQLEAIDITKNKNFSSGVHYHATGTGKSWIALQLILEYQKINPKCTILWICEQKSILNEQFSKAKLKEKGYENIFNTFLIHNYSINKDPNWYINISNNKFWNKPGLIIINRAYLTSDSRYEKIKQKIDLVIHDECHSIKNSSTQTFYKWLLATYPSISCIGFSATPTLQYKPFTSFLSKFSIYDAFNDDIIVPAKIGWLKTNDSNLTLEETSVYIKKQLESLPYKKVIVWCGIIEHCYEFSKQWQKLFPDYLIALDTSTETTNLEEFYKLEEKGFLFCAAKHREGSDISNLDCCIFLDKVEDRGSKTFIQCMGRVLRKDKLLKKKFGLVLDLRSSCCMDIINRIHPFLYLKRNIFPWKTTTYPMKINNKLVICNQLDMLKESDLTNLSSPDETRDYSIDEIKGMFRRSIDDKDLRYHQRLDEELEMFEKKKLFSYVVRALDILHMTKNIPHVTRGSCGSSLVCYLLGISHVDPVKYNISFARFLNDYRDTLPDIDFDFPYNIRKDVFMKLEQRYPGKIARISNHVYYHEKSALRDSIRMVTGLKKQIPKHELNKTIQSFDKTTRIRIHLKKKHLLDSFRTYSLHCGGIIYYPDGVPQDKVLEKNKPSIIQQVTLNKEDVSKEKHFKIDILSSRGLAILYEILGHNILFEEPILDSNVFDMLSNGFNIGLTLAESPLMRTTLIKMKPQSIDDLAICLSIIRPAARKAKSCESIEEIGNNFVYDDDAIIEIARVLSCTQAQADKYRRIFAKQDEKGIKEFKKVLAHSKVPVETKITLLESLEDLAKYSFCKSHAYSYAQLVYQLAYLKYYKPLDFWRCVLKHSESSYRKWVHLYEAKLAGLDYKDNKQISIYAENRRNKIESLESHYEQLRTYGYWNMKDDSFFPGCYLNKVGNVTYNMKGIIASTKTLKNELENGEVQFTTVLFLSTSKQQYIEVMISDLEFVKSEWIGCQLECAMMIHDNPLVFEAGMYKFF